MGARAIVALLLFVSPSAPLLAQEATPAAETPAGGRVDPVELMRQLGADEEDVLKFQVLSQALGPEVSPVLLLMMMEGEGNVDDDFLPILLLMRAAVGSVAGGPAAVVSGDRLCIVEDGTVYVLSMNTLKLEGSVAYRPPKQAAGLPQDLLPMLQQARERAQASACLSNMKQLVLAALMYAQDWDETLPGEAWVDEVQPYHNNPGILMCPGAPDRAHGYALNDALAGAKLADIPRPAETVLFFETELPDDVPFGGPDGLPAEPRHAGRVTVGYVDGHAKLIPLDEARKLLEQDPFQ